MGGGYYTIETLNEVDRVNSIDTEGIKQSIPKNTTNNKTRVIIKLYSLIESALYILE